LIRRALFIAAFTGFAMPTMAQTPATEAPLSAIDWLSNTVIEPRIAAPFNGAPVAEEITTEAIDIAPLDTLAIDGVGLLPTRVTGLPAAFWGPTSVRDLIPLLADQSTDMPGPARDLLFRILLAELNPPVDGGRDHALFLARVDTLLRFGALEQAQALLERAGPTEAALFRRWFDTSLLSGNEDRACAVMRAAPDIAPTFSARVFCLARGNDWSAAALSLDTARALGVLNTADDALLARFLDPELHEDQPMEALPTPLTPLSYRMLVALGEAPSANSLPLAFSHAALDPVAGWKPRLEAAERLTRYGGVAPTRLFALYTERRAAASGGIWERVSAVQAVDAALLGGDDAALWRALPKAVEELDRVELFRAFAQHYGARIAMLTPPKSRLSLRDRIVLLGSDPEALADTISDPFLGGLARGLVPEGTTTDDLRAAIATAFEGNGAPLPAALRTMLRENRLGEATLRALSRLDAADPDPGDVEVGLTLLRRLGFESAARETALALLLAQGGA
jgi:hypothetical protein